MLGGQNHHVTDLSEMILIAIGAQNDQSIISDQSTNEFHLQALTIPNQIIGDVFSDTDC